MSIVQYINRSAPFSLPFTPGPDGRIPAEEVRFDEKRGWYDGHSYGSIDAYLAGASGTFSRGSDATYFDASGILRNAGPNVLRLDHDPVTGKELGARMEGAATNRITRNQSFEAPWAFNAPASRTGGIDDPAGGNNATRISGLGNMYAAGINWGVGASARVEPSIFVRRVTASGILLMTSRHGSGYGRFEIDLAALGPGWRHITRNTPGVTVVNEHITNPSGTWSPSFSNASGDTEIVVDVWCAQGDLGTFPASPIPTDASAVTRLADSLTFARAAPPEGTVVIEGRTPLGTGGNQVLWQWDDGTDANRYRLVRVNDGNLRAIMTVAGVDVVNLDLGPVANDADLKVVPSWRAGQFAASLNGAAAVVNTSYTGPLPVVSTVRCGSGATSGDKWYGTMARLGIFDRAYNPAELSEVWA